mgnify:CR=1 FL=1
MDVKITLLKHGPKVLPEYATKGSAGLDVMAAIHEPISIGPGERILVPSGFKLEIPVEYEVQIRPRSGLAIKHGITVLNSPGTIDSDYRGDIGVILINLSKDIFTVNNGDRIAQIIIAKHEFPIFIETEKLKSSDRGESGFGSTGEN